MLKYLLNKVYSKWPSICLWFKLMVQLIALLWILSQPCSPTQQKENENWTKFDLLKLTLSSIRSTIFHMKKLFAANFYVTHHLIKMNIQTNLRQVLYLEKNQEQVQKLNLPVKFTWTTRYIHSLAIKTWILSCILVKSKWIWFYELSIFYIKYKLKLESDLCFIKISETLKPLFFLSY